MAEETRRSGRGREPIASLETDKVSVDVPSPVAGVLTEQLVEEGANVAVGAVIARIDQGARTSAAATAADAGSTRLKGSIRPVPARTPQLRDTPNKRTGSAHQRFRSLGCGMMAISTMSPAVRRAVLEYHVDPTRIRGSGKDGRLTKDDVIAAAQAQKSSSPGAGRGPGAAGESTGSGRTEGSASGSPPFPGERGTQGRARQVSRLRQTIAKRLKEAQNTAAMLTTFNDVDMTAVIEARARYKDLFEKKHGIRLGFMGFFVKAARSPRSDVPSVNASIDGDEIVYRDYLDVSVAVPRPRAWSSPSSATPGLSFADIEKTIADFGKRAKDGTLKMEEMTGGTFTISNGGVFGSLLRPRSSTRRSRRCSACTGSRSGRWSGRPDRRPPDDVPRAKLRPPPGRRPRGGHFPRPRQGSDRGSDAAADRS